MSATDTRSDRLPTDAPDRGTPVEGSGGLLLEIDGKIVPNYAATMVSFDEGDVVNGKVVRIDKDEVLVDIGYKSEGVIPSNELSIRKSVDPAEEVELGEEVDALVLTKEDAEGRLILSKKRARFEKAWRRIEAAAESGEPVEGSVIEVVKGGLILDLGVRGFLPASLVDIRRVHNLDEFMGQTLECKVIELNRSRNNVVLSRRAVLEEERKEVREQILGRLEPGQVVEGKISNIVDFGAFVDLDGIDGLIHISELSWSHVNHPSEVVAIGDTVRIKVLDIDRDRQRISLGLKQTQEDPWQRVISTHRPGDVLEGTVTKVVAFGAFVEILPGVEGLVHISELADHHVESPSEVVEPGATLNVKILEIDEERRRLSLEHQAGRGAEHADGRPRRRRSRGSAEGSSGRGFRRRDRGSCRGEDSSSSQAAGEEPTSTPPADEAPEASAEEPSAPMPRGAGCRGGSGRGACRGGPARSLRTRPAAEAEAAEARGRLRGAGAEEPAERRGSPDDAEEADRPSPTPSSPSRGSPPSPSGARGAADDRPHRRDRGREVRGAGGFRAAWARRRSPATRSSTSCSIPNRCSAAWSSAGAPRSRPDGRVDRDRIGEIVFADPEQLAWLEAQIHPLVGERIGAWLALAARRAPRSPWSRCRCCSSPGWRASSTPPSPSSPPTRCAARAPRPAATPWSASARRASSPRTRRRRGPST